ncbi:hypothetical protein I3760_03G081300 [Carya illinoinensis]|nr:hypothetical protein I3760_03G081300 [Carya illinoinensis]
MGRGVSAGGGQSSLGYLFGTGETTKNTQVAQNQEPATKNGPSLKTAAASQPIDKQIPAGVQGHLTNNYSRVDGQNCGNFITCRIGLQPKFTLPLVVDLRWGTSLVVVGTDVFDPRECISHAL